MLQTKDKGLIFGLDGQKGFEREFSIMTVVNWKLERLADYLFGMSDCFGSVHDVGQGRVWV